MRYFHLVQNIPSPYRIHATIELRKQLLEHGVELMTHYMSDMSRGHDERPLSWRNPDLPYPHKYWKDYGIGCHHFNPGLVMYLRRVKPDYLAVGSPFDTITGLLLSGFCKANVKTCGVEGNTKNPGVMTGIKGWLKRWSLSKYEFIDVPGKDSERYVALHQTMTKRQMPKTILLPNLVETTRFKTRVQFDASRIAEVRKKLGEVHGEIKLCIIPAKLHEQKGLMPFISLLSPEMLHGWKINIFGSGLLKDQIVDLIHTRKIDDYIAIHDFVAYDDMPLYYASSDLFLLPSLRDPNPLSVVEAINSGLAVAVSSQAGNVDEAVSEGRNGWVLPVLDTEKFRNCLRSVFTASKAELYAMGRISFAEKAPFWNVERGIANYIKGLGIV